MTIKTADPLPECHLCELPTARSVWEANGGLCTGCTRGVADTVRMLRPGAVELDRARRQALLEGRPLPTADPTVFVETFTPDVPGQLPVPGAFDAVFGDVYTDDQP